MVHPSQTVDGRPDGAVVAAAGPEAELVDGVGQPTLLWVVGRDARLDDVDAAEPFLDGPLAPGAVHALAGVLHVGAVVHHELDLAVDADLVGVLDGVLVGGAVGTRSRGACLEEGEEPVEVLPPGVDPAVRLS
jgi:hypothetical protein